MTQNDLPPEHLGTGEQPKSLNLKIRVRNWLVDAFISLCCVLVVGMVFDQFTDKEFLDRALKFQTYLYDSVKALNPLNIFTYIGDVYDYLFFRLDNWCTYLLPIGLANFIMKILFFPVWAIVIGGAWFILPITMFFEGNVFELVLVLIVFVPLAFLVMGASCDDDGFSVFFGIFLAIVATTLVFWLVQLAMVAALFLLGKLVSLAATWAATSMVGSYVYWCCTKSTEHSVTERVLHLVRRAVARA
jgi:hypothetical protein